MTALQTRVTDLTATLDATQRGRLEARLAAIDRAGRAQVAVLLLPSTEPETIEQFGIRLAEAWKVGRNDAKTRVRWRFTTANARIKLHRLYPSIKP